MDSRAGRPDAGNANDSTNDHPASAHVHPNTIAHVTADAFANSKPNPITNIYPASHERLAGRVEHGRPGDDGADGLDW